MAVSRLVVPAQAPRHKREHMARKMRNSDRVQDQKSLLVRHEPQTRTALRVAPADPTVPRLATQRRSPGQRTAHDPASAVPHKMPDALPHRRRKAEVVEPLQNRVQKLPIRALRNRHRYRLQRRERPRIRLRYRPVNVQPHSLRRAAPTTPSTRKTPRRKPDQIGLRKLPKQRARRNALQPTGAVSPVPELAKRDRKPRTTPLRVRRQQRPNLRQLRRPDAPALNNPIHDGKRNTSRNLSPDPEYRPPDTPAKCPQSGDVKPRNQPRSKYTQTTQRVEIGRLRTRVGTMIPHYATCRRFARRRDRERMSVPGTVRSPAHPFNRRQPESATGNGRLGETYWHGCAREPLLALGAPRKMNASSRRRPAFAGSRSFSAIGRKASHAGRHVPL